MGKKKSVEDMTVKELIEEEKELVEGLKEIYQIYNSIGIRKENSFQELIKLSPIKQSVNTAYLSTAPQPQQEQQLEEQFNDLLQPSSFVSAFDPAASTVVQPMSAENFSQTDISQERDNILEDINKYL
jgi:hypothetical protein